MSTYAGWPIDTANLPPNPLNLLTPVLTERPTEYQDLKDKNIICHRHGNAQLIDFGSAAYVREGSKFEMFLGTLDFVAPEVLKGIPNCGKEIDIYGHWG
ncbi:hypothetical protein PtA15_8A541 [Puccinia triticina]|uniref:Protein kinase domain-containing protein n=1 Tax=Puccinia triticina TaxID=208348 RepID=A0ABY7CQT8_9BASI|nr:uncharacterized protein PtA15_8A541 [Puccinia triticina]WAQ87636.1 hypothetical protein PtA15_8A541 [Puccinia triticina]